MSLKNSRMMRLGLLFTGMAFFISSCSRSPVPSFLFIPQFILNTDYASQGSNSHGITDAWVYVDDSPIGVFQLPATVPIDFSGSSKITIFPGIKKDGISSTRIPYPFYGAYMTNLNLQKSKVDTLVPDSKYLDGATFALLEDFESGSDFTGITPVSGSSVVFEGNKSGRSILDGSANSFSLASSPYSLPGGGTRIFLELNYRNQQQFDIFARANYSGGNPDLFYLITITPKEGWNKVYIDLTSAVSSVSADSYQVVFKAELPDSVSSAEYYWDNIKIVHF